MDKSFVFFVRIFCKRREKHFVFHVIKKKREAICVAAINISKLGFTRLHLMFIAFIIMYCI